MQTDLPHVLYKSLKDRKKGEKKNYRVNPDDPAFARQQAAYEKALARQRAKMEGKEPYTVEELFR